MKTARPVRREAVGKGPNPGHLADGLPHCGRDVLSASMTTAPIGDCEDCATAQRDELSKSTKNNGHT